MLQQQWLWDVTAHAVHAETSEQSALAGAAAQLDTAQDRPGSGYGAHPAVVDASLHMGAYLGALPDQAGAAPSASTTRVPSALAAFCAGRGATRAECWAAVGDLAAQPGDAALSSYWLHSSTAAGVTLSGLLAKPMKAGSVAVAPHRASIDSGMVYELQRKAAEALLPIAGSSIGRKRVALAWRHITGQGKSVPEGLLPLSVRRSSSIGAGALRASAASLAHMQHVLAQQDTHKPAGLDLHWQAADGDAICGLSSARGSLQRSVTAAGALGLLRTAAQEYPAMAWQACSSSMLTAPDLAYAAPPGVDAFGVQHSQSVVHRPQMSLAAPDSSSSSSLTPQLSGSKAITGGLGGIGLLLSLWAAEQGSAHVQLLGRSGRAQADALPNLACMPHVTITRCDVGSTEEAAQLRRDPVAGGPLRQIWHAGGLLQDATLPNQTLSALRAVAAPKLDGVERLSFAVAGTPLDGMTLFSSTAALLGPPGQANYAAANSQLNAWSLGMQAAGALHSRPGMQAEHMQVVDTLPGLSATMTRQLSNSLATSSEHDFACLIRHAQHQHHVGRLGDRHGRLQQRDRAAL